MNELIEFLTTKEIIIVYCVALVASLLCIIIYIVEKNNDKLRKRHNTKELNKLVEQVKEETEESSIPTYSEEPVLYTIDDTYEESAVNELLEPTIEVETIDNLTVEEEEVDPEPVIIEPIEILEEDELEYTTIEPDQETAKEELKKLTEELQKQADIEETGQLTLNNYEETQEENAIISLEELMEKGKDLYAANELTQYQDEGNEPISIQELGKTTEYREPFIIEEVISDEEKQEVALEVEKVHLDDFNTISVESDKVEVSKFKSSPIISPVYGIEKNNELELENTANYEKFDQEIRKTNEFLVTLRELQDKLD